MQGLPVQIQRHSPLLAPKWPMNPSLRTFMLDGISLLSGSAESFLPHLNKQHPPLPLAARRPLHSPTPSPGSTLSMKHRPVAVLLLLKRPLWLPTTFWRSPSALHGLQGPGGGGKLVRPTRPLHFLPPLPCSTAAPHSL